MGIDQHNLSVMQHQGIHRGVSVHPNALTQDHVDVMQMQIGVAVGAADHAISITLVNSHGTNERMAAAHLQLRPLLGHAFTARHRQERLPVGAVAIIPLRIDHLEIVLRANPQSVTLYALLKHRGTTH